ncbi:MAG TPA: hypothetical protein VG247_08890 [Pseudonocardiaceae bacterium]|nr:hypothetical protein [Pseudonocardiaceae bacterium]
MAESRAVGGWETAVDVTDWRLIVESRTRRARTDLALLDADPLSTPDTEVARAAALESLAIVDTVLRTRATWWQAPSVWWSGWRIERAWRALHEAEVYLIAADPRLSARLPALTERINPCLPDTDLRRIALSRLRPDDPPSQADRIVVTDAVRAAFDASDEAHASARALRNKLFVAALSLLLVNVLLGLVSSVWPALLPMCVAGSENQLVAQLICAGGGAHPGAGEVWLVALMGGVGASIAAVVLLVRRRPSLSPYVLAGYQALIKVLLGALLAVVGVLALGAGLVEGLVFLHSQDALLFWAVLLGYSQQIGTRLLDNYADRLLDRVRPLEGPGND